MAAGNEVSKLVCFGINLAGVGMRPGGVAREEWERELRPVSPVGLQGPALVVVQKKRQGVGGGEVTFTHTVYHQS